MKKSKTYSIQSILSILYKYLYHHYKKERKNPLYSNSKTLYYVMYLWPRSYKPSLSMRVLLFYLRCGLADPIFVVARKCSSLLSAENNCLFSEHCSITYSLNNKFIGHDSIAV